MPYTFYADQYYHFHTHDSWMTEHIQKNAHAKDGNYVVTKWYIFICIHLVFAVGMFWLLLMKKRTTCHLGSDMVIYIRLSYIHNLLHHTQSPHMLCKPTATKPLTHRYPPPLMELQEPQHQTWQNALHLAGTKLWSSSPLPVYTKLCFSNKIWYMLFHKNK
jgi:hypothetical protein